ncbi:MAG TPA: PD-(D/E)XK nuclease family protein [Candidatus Paceibacterota bacterium]|nr:PD-(D/E)XK nuclease family protein [Candidatus Paceibacterota bacterium]
MAFGYKLKWEKGRFNPASKEPYTISRSKVERFTECPRCFWMEARFGIGRPDMPSFTLNNAVDELFKREFDIRRKDGKAHPIMEQYGVDAVPFAHEQLEEWRDALKRGIKYHHPETNIILRGGIDDIWKSTTSDEVYIVDYKATAGKDTVTLDDEWKNSYKRQIEVYQWLFRKNGFTVSPTAYFVYANGKNDREAFDGKLEFEVTLLPYEGDDSWVEPTLIELKKCLMSEDIPAPGKNCDYCLYREYAGKKLMELHRASKK